MGCIVSIQEREHAHQQGVMDAFDDAINDMASELIKLPDYSPNLFQNMITALLETTADNQAIFEAMVNHSACVLSLQIRGWVSDYWEKQAADKAIKELSK